MIPTGERSPVEKAAISVEEVEETPSGLPRSESGEARAAIAIEEANTEREASDARAAIQILEDDPAFGHRAMVELDELKKAEISTSERMGSLRTESANISLKLEEQDQEKVESAAENLEKEPQVEITESLNRAQEILGKGGNLGKAMGIIKDIAQKTLQKEIALSDSNKKLLMRALSTAAAYDSGLLGIKIKLQKI